MKLIRMALICTVLFMLILSAESNGQTIIATGSIQEAVDKAKDGDTIVLKDKTYNEHVFIPKSLNIEGQGPCKTIVDGSKTTPPIFGSVFIIGEDNEGNSIPDVTVTLSGLTIQGGSGTHKLVTLIDSEDAGGGIYIDHSTVTLKDCVVRDNHVLLRPPPPPPPGTSPGVASTAGGGIMNYGMLRLINCKITDNSAQSCGGIFNCGILTEMNDVTISENIAEDCGGVFNAGGSTFVLNSGTILVIEPKRVVLGVF